MASAEVGPRSHQDRGRQRASLSANLAALLVVLPTVWLWAVPTGQHPEIEESGFTSAHVCGECHVDIYNSWKHSLHASSLADPIFDAAYMQAVKEGGDEARQLCLRCHAPMVMANDDFDLSEGVTREGVSCDFCHSVTAVHLDGREDLYSLDVGKVKRSVLRSAASPAHEVAYSVLHEKAEFCGGCHNFTSASGKAIMSTYDEWKEGPYAREGVQCQDCHMVLSKGRVVAEEIKPSGTQVHLHSLIHDTDQLRSALTVQIVNAQRSGRRLQLDVELENVGSGHCVPTGMPSREVLLTVNVDDGVRTYSQNRSYRKVVADAAGRVLKEDYQALLHGARVLNDNRIRPRETRNERFRFDLSQDQRGAKVAVTLTYSYSPTIIRRRELNIELGRVERVVY